MKSVSLLCAVLVTVCLVVDLTRGQGSNCKINNDCIMTRNFKIINLRPPGQPARNIKVCCMRKDGIQSKYFRAASATATKPAFCECDFCRIKGTCKRGEQCTASNAKSNYVIFNKMQICCATNTSRVTRFAPIRGTRNYDCQCTEPSGDDWTGNCWKGSQCDGCSGGGEANGVKLCCANCQKKGLNINLATKTCNC